MDLLVVILIMVVHLAAVVAVRIVTVKQDKRDKAAGRPGPLHNEPQIVNVIDWGRR